MIILEGCDGVGKTSTIELLKKSGICCSDRSKDVFSRYMVKEVSMKERARVYFEYLNMHDDFIIFLVNNDKDELERRINLRPIKNEFDENALPEIYQQLYQRTIGESVLTILPLSKINAPSGRCGCIVVQEDGSNRQIHSMAVAEKEILYVFINDTKYRIYAVWKGKVFDIAIEKAD